MDCFPIECGEYAVSPVFVTPDCPTKPCEDPPICYPCLPRCQKVMVCREKPSPPPRRRHPDDDCCHRPPSSGNESRRKHNERDYDSHEKRRDDSNAHCSSNSCGSPCKPVKTKYIIPCYRYEDGRIFQERYVPTRYGSLAMSAYRRNGIQDQLYGYRAAVRYLCVGKDPCGSDCVHTIVEPMRKIYPKITQEVNKLPVTAFKRNGMQDQEHSKMLGTANFLQRCPRDVSIECDVCYSPAMRNQPTVLTRRACEVACGTRPRRKPFVLSTYSADPDNEVRRYHSEDEQGNCCFHFERKKPECCQPSESYRSCMPCQPCEALVPCRPCVSIPECQYSECIYARPADPSKCCYYCD